MSGRHAAGERTPQYRSQIIIPIAVGILIPGALALWLESSTTSISPPRAIAGIVLFLAGCGLVIPSARAVYWSGDAPLLDRAPARLITDGPYLRTRNPMALGMILVLTGEGVLLWSSAILVWAGIFTVVSHLLIIRVEEPSLQRAFGDRYRRYRAATPRWIPHP
jgi:protein-S-isoprenylcysteine O-methyltransferase Ste14